MIDTKFIVEPHHESVQWRVLGYKSGIVHDSIIAVSWWRLEMGESAIHNTMLSGVWCAMCRPAMYIPWSYHCHESWVCTNIIIGVVSLQWYCVSQDISVSMTLSIKTWHGGGWCARCTPHTAQLCMTMCAQYHLDCHPCHKTAAWCHLPGQWSHVTARAPTCPMYDDTDHNGHQMVPLWSQCHSASQTSVNQPLHKYWTQEVQMWDYVLWNIYQIW